IPAMKYRVLAPRGPTGTKRSSAFELHPTWEVISEAYEVALQHYAPCMPQVCAAGSHTPSPVGLFASTPLLRHFSECLLHDLVDLPPFRATFEQKVADSLLYRCLHPSNVSGVPGVPGASQLSVPPGDTLEEYKQWLMWREDLRSAHTAAGFA